MCGGGAGVASEEGPTAWLEQSQFSIQGPSHQLGERGKKVGEKSHISAQMIFPRNCCTRSPLPFGFGSFSCITATKTPTTKVTIPIVGAPTPRQIHHLSHIANSLKIVHVQTLALINMWMRRKKGGLSHLQWTSGADGGNITSELWQPITGESNRNRQQNEALNTYSYLQLLQESR